MIQQAGLNLSQSTLRGAPIDFQPARPRVELLLDHLDLDVAE